MILTDELCDKLCAAAREKSKEIGIDISFAISDENGLPRVYRRYGEALVLSITLVDVYKRQENLVFARGFLTQPRMS